MTPLNRLMNDTNRLSTVSLVTLCFAEFGMLLVLWPLAGHATTVAVGLGCAAVIVGLGSIWLR